MNTIDFRSAIKLVHPDSNPNITNAGEKVRTIKMFRDDEQKLYNYMVMWGLIKGKVNPKQKVSVPDIVPNRKYYGNIRVKIFGIGDGFIVSHTTKTRVYFTRETYHRTGRRWTSFKKVEITGVRKK